MGVEIKLSDNELPVSPVFVDFLAHVIDNREFEKAKWGDQLSEELSSDQKQVVEQATANAQRVIADPEGQKYVARSYELLVALLTGNLEVIKDIQLRFHFINIIGAPIILMKSSRISSSGFTSSILSVHRVTADPT